MILTESERAHIMARLKTLKLSQAAWARRCGVSRARIGAVLHGTPTDPMTLNRWLESLGDPPLRITEERKTRVTLWEGDRAITSYTLPRSGNGDGPATP